MKTPLLLPSSVCVYITLMKECLTQECGPAVITIISCWTSMWGGRHCSKSVAAVPFTEIISLCFLSSLGNTLLLESGRCPGQAHAHC